MEADAFLDRIANRLGRTTRGHVARRPDEVGVPSFHRTTPLGPNPADLATRFEAELTRVGGKVFREPDRASAAERLRAVLDELGATNLVSFERSEFIGWPLAWLWDERGCRAWAGDSAADAAVFRAHCAEAHAGITTVDAAIAATGTIVLTAALSRPRQVSLLPPVHVALIDRSQLVARLGEAMQLVLARGAPPSATTFVTGPSRTSDIENDLTIGVHGPAAVIVIMAD